MLRRGGALLPPDQRNQVGQRALETLSRLAVVEDGRANWPSSAGDALIANGRIRVQWCHGAAGVLTAMWDAAPDDDAWGELLLAAGRLVWEAGPLRDAPATTRQRLEDVTLAFIGQGFSDADRPTKTRG